MLKNPGEDLVAIVSLHNREASVIPIVPYLLRLHDFSLRFGQCCDKVSVGRVYFQPPHQPPVIPQHSNVVVFLSIFCPAPHPSFIRCVASLFAASSFGIASFSWCIFSFFLSLYRKFADIDRFSDVREILPLAPPPPLW